MNTQVDFVKKVIVLNGKMIDVIKSVVDFFNNDDPIHIIENFTSDLPGDCDREFHHNLNIMYFNWDGIADWRKDRLKELEEQQELFKRGIATDSFITEKHHAFVKGHAVKTLNLLKSLTKERREQIIEVFELNNLEANLNADVNNLSLLSSFERDRQKNIQKLKDWYTMYATFCLLTCEKLDELYNQIESLEASDVYA